MKKTGILLLNMGGPDKIENVRPFLYNLFSDPEIIYLPLSFLFQKPLAKLIVTARGKEAEHNYSLMGGASPQLPLTREQSDALKAELRQQTGDDIPIYVAMRYWHPFTDEALDQIVADGIERVIVLTLYPHFSYTTTGASFNELKRRIAARGLDLELSFIAGYAQQKQYLEAVAECIETGIKNNSWDCADKDVHLLFSAHSLPLSHIKRTKDPYPEHIFKCATTLIETYFPDNPWDLAYQSKVGSMPWLGPYTDSALQYLAAKNHKNVLLIPISFVTDHVETLVEIDLQYIPQGREMGITHCHRAPSLNSSPKFIKALSQLVTERLIETRAHA